MFVCVCRGEEEEEGGGGGGISVRASTGPLTARTSDVVEIKRCVKVFDLQSAAGGHKSIKKWHIFFFLPPILHHQSDLMFGLRA